MTWRVGLQAGELATELSGEHARFLRCHVCDALGTHRNTGCHPLYTGKLCGRQRANVWDCECGAETPLHWVRAEFESTQSTPASAAQAARLATLHHQEFVKCAVQSFFWRVVFAASLSCRHHGFGGAAEAFHRQARHEATWSESRGGEHRALSRVLQQASHTLGRCIALRLAGARQQCLEFRKEDDGEVWVGGVRGNFRMFGSRQPTAQQPASLRTGAWGWAKETTASQPMWWSIRRTKAKG